MDVVNIFISHKHEDEQKAKDLKKILKDYDHDEKLNFYLSEEILHGDEWYPWIKDKLHKSQLLLVLFNDVTQGSDWCVYEAGLFEGLGQDRHGRIICLHPSTVKPPEPLRNLQTVVAEPGRVKWFLEQFYTDTRLTGLPDPIAPDLAEQPKKMDQAAEKIINLIAHHPAERRPYGEHIFLHVKNPQSINDDQIPPDAEVTSDTASSWKIFDLDEGTWTWKDLEEEARKNQDTLWIEALAYEIYRASKRKPVNPIQATFRACRGEKRYRPILYRTDWQADGSVIFRILFYEDVTWQHKDIPKKHLNVLISLVMATRFKYELLKKYLSRISTPVTEEEKQQAYNEIRQTIRSIEGEAMTHGMHKKQALTEAFQDKDQQTIEQMYDEWYTIRDQLMNDLKQKNCESIEEHLSKLLSMNKQYLGLATRRYSELMTES